MKNIEISNHIKSKYWRLNRLLLIVLAIELGYFLLLILIGSINAFDILFFDNEGFASPFTQLIFIYLPFLILYIGNLIGGLYGIILNYRENVEGYPGTGHSLNWIYIIMSSWPYSIFLFGMLPNGVID